MRNNIGGLGLSEDYNCTFTAMKILFVTYFGAVSSLLK